MKFSRTIQAVQVVTGCRFCRKEEGLPCGVPQPRFWSKSLGILPCEALFFLILYHRFTEDPPNEIFVLLKVLGSQADL